MSELVETELSSFEEEVKKPVWVDAMVEEYDSIVRKNVWEVVPRPIEKSMVGSRWIYKVKHAVDGSIKKHKAKFFAKGFLRWRELIMRRPLLLYQGTHPSTKF